MLEPTSLCLRILALDSVCLHEDFDPLRVDCMVASLRREGVLKNPIIVAESTPRHIVLDGATRTMALRQLGIPHVVAQMMRYDDDSVHLRIWHHAIVGLPASALESHFAQIAGLSPTPCSLPELESCLASGDWLFGLVHPNGRCTAYRSQAERRERMRQLNRAVEGYRGKATVHRTSDLDLAALLEQHPDLNAIIAFPPFKPQDVTQCAHNQIMFPMGVTRHVIRGRALGLNVPLETLASDQSLEEKNAWLQEKIHDCMRRSAVRLYEEPTFVFDEL